MAAGDKVRAERRRGGALLWITLDAPKGNVLDTAMIGGIDAALVAHGADPALKGIVFEGAGDHFSFGASVEEHRPEEAPAMLARFHALLRRLQAVAAPTLAVVRGQCLGGGLELAACCSWIFAGPTARFGQPEIKLGVIAPAASVLLPWRLGAGRALDLLVSGRTIDAEAAARIGLAHAVAERPDEACETFFAEHIEPGSASSLRFAERAARHALDRLLGPELARLERLYLDELMATPDAREGIAAFIERRRPRFGAQGGGAP
ncbi:MAG: enoyl-CoA hydratase/isomerase family protein [Deltaproteobacteria bacterium]|nr:enoyl-CoA hydratase/isomerase family protein [Deltaproteobacteria bacterium]